MASTAIIAGAIALTHQQQMAQQQYQFDWNNHVQAAVAQGNTLPQAQAMATAHLQQVAAQQARLTLAQGAVSSARRRGSFLISAGMALAAFGFSRLSLGGLAVCFVGLGIAGWGGWVADARKRRAELSAAQRFAALQFRVDVDGDGVTTPITRIDCVPINAPTLVWTPLSTNDAGL
jgi:hypothetical protein